MNATPEFFASAYLDGELTDDERRLAEADPTVMAEVDELRALRDRLAAVEPPSTASRDAAITAAMGEFHEIYGASAPTPAAPPPAVATRRERPVPFRRRHLITPWLGIAAAVLVVGLLGLVVASSLRSGDDSVDVASDAAVVQPAEELADAPASDDAGSTERRLIEADLDAPAVADLAEAPAMESADDMLPDTATEPAADTEAGESALDTMVDPSGFFSLAGQPSDGQPIAPIRSGEQLTDAAGYLLDLAERGELPATPETACPYPVFADGAVQLAPNEVVIPAHVAILPDDDLVVAIDIDTCDIVLDAPIER